MEGMANHQEIDTETLNQTMDNQVQAIITMMGMETLTDMVDPAVDMEATEEAATIIMTTVTAGTAEGIILTEEVPTQTVGEAVVIEEVDPIQIITGIAGVIIQTGEAHQGG